MSKIHPVIIIGAGPAGIGIAALLSQCALKPLILERGHIGESFRRWPEETVFISPSFTGNFFGAVDLNAITPSSSPAYGTQTEHLTGKQYTMYLEELARVHDVEVKEKTEVKDIEIEESGVKVLTTADGELLSCRVLIWAGGEFQYPKSIPHTVRVGTSYKDLPKGHHVIIGGAESGMEAAYNLVELGSTVTVIDPTAPWSKRVSDSSYGLSPYTCSRVRSLQESGRAEFIAETTESITAGEVRTKNHNIRLEHPAIDATGFDIKQSLAGKLFDFANGHPQLTDRDESTKFKNVYLVGPNVQHGKAIFCFIYKFRQRFAVIVREILSRWGENSPMVDEYAKRGFLLDDLSCCDGECEC